MTARRILEKQNIPLINAGAETCPVDCPRQHHTNNRSLHRAPICNLSNPKSTG